MPRQEPREVQPQDAKATLAIPIEPLLREFGRAAVPGFYGKVRIEFLLDPAYLERILLLQVRRVGQTRAQAPARSPAGAREPVQGTGPSDRDQFIGAAIELLVPKLVLRPQVLAIVGHYQDGRLLTCEVEE